MGSARLDRLELVVRRLADRILGEELTFDAIAEAEASEQGVAFVPPPAASQVSDECLASLEERISALESRPLPVPQQSQDVSPLLEAIANVSGRIAALEKIEFPPDLSAELEKLKAQVMEQERVIQALLQASEDSRAKLDKNERTITFIMREGQAADRKAG